jgi:hypothetical protein
MGRKERKKRGKRGGSREFLKKLKRELHCVGVFDPDIAFSQPHLATLLPPEQILYPPSVPRQIKIPRRQRPVEKRPARALDTFVSSRVPTRPLPPYVYARKPPTATPRKLRIWHSVPVKLKIKLVIPKPNTKG